MNDTKPVRRAADEDPRILGRAMPPLRHHAEGCSADHPRSAACEGAFWRRAGRAHLPRPCEVPDTELDYKVCVKKMI